VISHALINGKGRTNQSINQSIDQYLTHGRT